MANKVLLSEPVDWKGTVERTVYCVVNGSGTGFQNTKKTTGQLYPPRNPK